MLAKVRNFIAPRFSGQCQIVKDLSEFGFQTHGPAPTLAAMLGIALIALASFFYCCGLAEGLTRFGHWHASQSGSSIEHAFSVSVAEACATMFSTAFNLLARSVSIVDFSTWVAPIDLR